MQAYELDGIGDVRALIPHGHMVGTGGSDRPRAALYWNHEPDHGNPGIHDRRGRRVSLAGDLTL